MSDIDERLRSLEARLQELEDIQAIRRLKLRYAALCDAGYSPEELAALYTEDGVVHSPLSDLSYRGRAEISTAFRNVSSYMTFAVHYMIGDSIEIDASGVEASATWYLLQPTTAGGDAYWVAGSYSDRYRKVGGSWYIAYSKMTPVMFSLHGEGWAKRRFVSSTPGAEAPTEG